MSTIETPLRIENNPWRQALPAVLLLVAAIGLLYRETALAMVAIWARSDTFMHAFLVVPISLWLIWRRRARLAALAPRPAPLFLLPLLAAAAAWLLAATAGVDTVAEFAFVAMLVLVVPAVLGTEVAGAILFPLLFLFFAVPFGEFMLPTMMQSTADFAVLALRASGVPVYREGLQFVIPSGNWSVVEECSGVRYLIASFMVGTLYAYLNYRSTRRRVLFVIASVAVPVLANWLRAYLIVMLGHLSGNKLATGVDHILYGWVFFGIVMFAMFFAGMRWAEPDDDAAAPARRDRAAPAAGLLAQAVVVGAALVMLLLPPTLVHGFERAEAAAAAPRFVLPERLNGWAATGDTPRFLPAFLGPSLETARRYRGAAGTVDLHVVYYRAQGPDHRLVSSANHLVHSTDPEWNAVAQGRASVDTAAGALELRSTEVLDRAPADRSQVRTHLVVWQVYWVDGRFVASDVKAKIAATWGRLRGAGDDGAALTLYADAGSPAASAAVLQAFVRDNLGTLDGLLRATRAGR